MCGTMGGWRLLILPLWVQNVPSRPPFHCQLRRATEVLTSFGLSKKEQRSARGLKELEPSVWLIQICRNMKVWWTSCRERHKDRKDCENGTLVFDGWGIDWQALNRKSCRKISKNTIHKEYNIGNSHGGVCWILLGWYGVQKSRRSNRWACEPKEFPQGRLQTWQTCAYFLRELIPTSESIVVPQDRLICYGSFVKWTIASERWQEAASQSPNRSLKSRSPGAGGNKPSGNWKTWKNMKL